MAVTRVTYSISEDTKKTTDGLKKEYNINLSELVDTLLKFDNNSIEKMFEMYQKMNPIIIEKWNRLETQKGIFVWNQHQMDLIKKFPTDNIKSDMVNIAAVKLYNLSQTEAPSEYIKLVNNQKEVIDATGTLINKYEEIKTEMMELKKDIEILKNK